MHELDNSGQRSESAHSSHSAAPFGQPDYPSCFTRSRLKKFVTSILLSIKLFTKIATAWTMVQFWTTFSGTSIYSTRQLRRQQRLHEVTYQSFELGAFNLCVHISPLNNFQTKKMSQNKNRIPAQEKRSKVSSSPPKGMSFRCRLGGFCLR